MQKVLFGAGDFSPPMLIFSGLKSRAPTDMYPANCRFVEQRHQLAGELMPFGVGGPVCGVLLLTFDFGPHVEGGGEDADTQQDDDAEPAGEAGRAFAHIAYDKGHAPGAEVGGKCQHGGEDECGHAAAIAEEGEAEVDGGECEYIGPAQLQPAPDEGAEPSRLPVAINHVEHACDTQEIVHAVEEYAPAVALIHPPAVFGV